NIDCDVRDKIWTDVKVADPKTGAYLVWLSYLTEDGDADAQEYADEDYVPYKGHYPGNSAGWLGADYFEETGADTGLFVSKRAFQVGSREAYDEPRRNTHVVSDSFYPEPVGEGWLLDFSFGNYLYVDGERSVFGNQANLLAFTAQDWMDVDTMRFPDAVIRGTATQGYLVGRFENMDTLVGLYQDQNDDTDVATAMMKIIDTEATITWDQEIYKDANTSATITVVDADENLNCNVVEYVPVFILVNPGSWNPVDGRPWEGEGGRSPTNFCMLKRTGGVDGDEADDEPVDGIADVGGSPIRWYNIYHSEMNAFDEDGMEDGLYYIQYPTEEWSSWNVVWFDTVDEYGITPVLFYAQETGVNTGVFQLNLNSILDDLGFNTLEVRDVLSAYYLDPNDEDDFKFDLAYIEEKNHSITSFTDATRADKDVYWIGRDPIYVQVIDANANVDPCCPEQVVVHICDVHNEDDVEWIILDETSSNSPVFFSNSGYELRPVWDALGNGEVVAELVGAGGFQLWFDNWKVEAYNEDDIYVRYNDVYYAQGVEGLGGIGDANPLTAMPPWIDRVRVDNDVSFDVMSIGDTQVYDGSTTKMYFLDRNGNRVSGYVNSDCIFIEVVDPDQDEDQLRRERIDGYWDGGYNLPFGPLALREFECDMDGREIFHPVNTLLGDTNIFNNGAAPKVYVLNPRSGYWAALDLLEDGVGSGTFQSVICVDLVSVYTCVPTLGTLPGDTVVAFYQDPSNHSDSAMISIKVGIGGGGTPPSQASTTTFVNAT
ncbi:hypothetical protein L0Y59_05305, partial [Candidatus Uhrbacteria bacterium]|nr:hypothetical protein [Candidatus Uhrbacteria bacterium]